MKSRAFSATKNKRDKRNCSTRNISHEGACSECTTNCQLVHGNRGDQSSSVCRFFKIMLGKDFSEVMFVPSGVARENKWLKYINKEACLEDTIGQKYPVKISEVDNAVAFKEGWCRFSSEHHLKEGDFLVFNHVRYVGKLHFVVHIYGKSGQEKVFFQSGHNKSVSTMNKNAVLLTETPEAAVMNSDSKKSPSPSTTPNNTLGEYTNGNLLQLDHASWDMEPIFMLDRDAQFIDDRTCLHDLSSFEKQDRPAAAKVSVNNNEPVTMNHAEKVKDSKTDTDLLDTFPVKRKFSSPESQPNKKQNAIIKDIIESAPVNVAPAMKMAVNGGARSNTHVPNMIESRDRCGPTDNIPFQRDVSISKTPSNKAKLDNTKNIDRSGPVSSAKDITKKIDTGGTIESALVNVATEMKMAVNNGERSSTHVQKMMKCRDRSGPADNIPVQRDVSILKTPSYMEKLNNKKNIDRSGPTISTQDIRQKVLSGGPIKTVKKELDTGDGPFHHPQCLSVKKKTIIPENVRRSSLNGKKVVKIPKTEPLCSEDFSTSFVGRESSTAVVDDKPYLILQSQLPSVLLSRETLRTIYLRAPDRKVFPVTYQQKNGVRILASGWQLFKSVYHLHAGDSCRIELEDEPKHIYRFEVLNRGNVLNRK